MSASSGRSTTRRAWSAACVVMVLCAGPAMSADPATGDEYRVGFGDILAVEVFQHQDLSGEFPVGSDGTIRYPLLEQVPVAGSTVAEVAGRLERALEADYYVDVQLEVTVKDFRSQPVTVLGEVGRPGTYYLKGPMELASLVAEAGGLKASAGAEIQIQRRSPTGEAASAELVTIDRDSLATGVSGCLVRAGDVVSVPAKQLYFITGEVVRPDQYEIEKGMTLIRAVSQAGGLGPFASQRVEIRRETRAGTEIFRVDLSKVRRGKEPDPEVLAGDVIIVERRFF